jgi:alpha-amylase/alpha-mannosidase (GH57 family)
MDIQKMPSAVENALTAVETSKKNEITTGVYVTVHGHFYQPPRENPYLEAIERQPSAEPFHDWNERIHHQCYRPNVFARVLNERGEIIDIVNNFEYLSFNVGPTLMSWLERYDLEVYQKIIEADRASCERLNGHGNAIAQPYNHTILPLANEADKITQIRWGKADFQSRFGREPEGMWLPETAVDYATLEVLIAENIRFIILSPSQAQRCRSLTLEKGYPKSWQEVGGSQINPTRPYRCYVTESQFIDIFFYDGPISADMGFHNVLSTSQYFAERLRQAIQGDHRPSQLINVATDGETFGHHKPGTEKCLAYAFTREFPARRWQVTNYAHYLSENPPTWEVMLKSVTSWSCPHGVERWRSECGCGGNNHSQQRWRQPLRESLDWLRDHLADIFETEGRKLFVDPWAARNDYINVLRDRAQVTSFLTRHRHHSLTPQEQIEALRLLEMQRNGLLMYTSCGWFFDELSRPEGIQILRYASRAVELAEEISGQLLEMELMERLAKAPSNSDRFQNGAEIYHYLVKPARINIKQVAAHYALSSLFKHHPQQDHHYAYYITQQDYQRQTVGALTLAMGELKMQRCTTGETGHLVFAVLHLGGWDFHCCVQSFPGRTAYSKSVEHIFATFKRGSAAKTILAMKGHFGEQSLGLENVFVEKRMEIMQQLAQETKTRLHELYTQIYRDNYSILVAFHQDRLPIPRELQVAAEITLSQRCLQTLQALEQMEEDVTARNELLQELEAIISEAEGLHLALEIPEGKKILERLTLRSLWHLLHECPDDSLTGEYTKRLIDLGHLLAVGMMLDRCQEIYYNWLQSHYKSDVTPELRPLLELGLDLAVDVRPWLQKLES